MTIKIKFNLGDTVWFIFMNKACSSIVINLTITAAGDDLVHHYEIRENPFLHGLTSFHEEDLFSSREGLLKSL